jgi:tetratricopeptide (TPR) repeat protein
MAAAGKAFQERKFPEAEALLVSALHIAEQFSPGDPRLAASLNNLAELYVQRGRYADAEPLYKRAIDAWGHAGTSQEPSLASALGNLGDLYRQTGRYSEAEPLYKRALQIREAANSPNDPRIAASVGKLGELYRMEGRFPEAETLLKRSLEIAEKSSGAPAWTSQLHSIILPSFIAP